MVALIQFGRTWNLVDFPYEPRIMKISLTLTALSIVACVQALSTSAANAYAPINGPAFMNSSKEAVELIVVDHSGHEVKLLVDFQSDRQMVFPKELDVFSIVVKTRGNQVELNGQDYVRQSNRLAQIHQIWIYDGRQLCVREWKFVSAAGIRSCDQVEKK